MLEQTTVDAPPRITRRQWIERWGWMPLLMIAVVAMTFVIVRSSIDLNAIREAARQGALEALATPSASQPAAVPAPTAAITYTVRPANRVGQADALVTIVEFSDFQCPYCGHFDQDVRPDLFKQYVDDGRVAFVYKHMAILGDESTWAAEAAECAADQGQFWEYHDRLFAHQNGENQGAFGKDQLLGFARDLNLNMAQFEPCLNNDQTLDRVQADTREGQQAGVHGTPTFFINGQPLVGAQPLASFQSLIQQVSGK
jgi:protein-disulfide isomerase